MTNALNLDQATRAIRAYVAADIPVFLWGAPGIGKSDTVRGVAKANALPLIDRRASQLDPVDVLGLPRVTASGRAGFAPPDWLPYADRDGAAGFLFLDELNAANPSTQSACFQLVLDRQLGDYRLPPAWRIIAAGNRQSDRAAAQRMPSALANRFAHIDVEPSVDAWALWATGGAGAQNDPEFEAWLATVAARVNTVQELPPVILAFIRFRPALLHLMPGQKADGANVTIDASARAFPSPRQWSEVGKIWDAPRSIRMSLVAGLVGEGCAAEFEGFIRVFLSLPSIGDILADPDGARVPAATETATLYAVATAIARKATAATFGAVLRYAARLPKEFEILAAVDAVRRDKTLTETAGYVGWINRNADVLT